MIMIFYFFSHPEEYVNLGETENGIILLEPKDTASKEAIHSYFRFRVEAEDELVADNTNELCQRMVNLFKQSKCYQAKSESEREEIINYLRSHPFQN